MWLQPGTVSVIIAGTIPYVVTTRYC
jgi:hypothetical protein